MHFLMHISEQANDFCNAQNKKTVCPDHVLDALNKMNLSRIYPKLAAIDEKALKKAVLDAKGTGKRLVKNATDASKHATETLKDPQKLRAAILSRLNAHMEASGKPGRVGKGKGDKDE